MNFTAAQWRIAIVLDVFIKSFAIFVAAAFVTLGTVMLGGYRALVFFVAIGAGISCLHFLCLLFGSGIASGIEAKRPNLPRTLKFVLALVIGNILFAVICTVFLMSPRDPVNGEAIISLYLVATNLITILPVAGFGCLLKRADRLH